ncbi:MAG: patatin-like phospholipase family protein [Deltaproteobacteria bacterium]|nr:patatin-like phospholipase family protein [Deltaproteobacteria bacterium]
MSRSDARGRLRARIQPAISLLCALAIATTGLGCFGFKTINVPLEQYDPDYGYRPTRNEIRRERGDISIYLAFSGGGTRAAALAYGVMQALQETLLVVDGEPRTMLEEVDTLSGVSGGSFPAAYYGLFDDRIFDEFEPRFLRRNIQGGIVWRAMIPWNLVRLFTPWLSRSEIAKGIYHKSVFDQATFQTLTDAKGPIIYINATDLSSGDRFTFTQGQFDVICSDLQALSIADAVAASSAVPMLLSPISMRNRAGTCGYEQHEWLDEALDNRLTDPRQYRAALSFTQLNDPDKKFLHLVDGGISDNLGLRAVLDIMDVTGSLERAAELMDSHILDKMVIITVNAETDPDPTIDLSSAAPGFTSMMNAVSGSQIRRYNFETLLLTHELLQRLGREARDSGYDAHTFMVDVSFENFPDEQDRRYFKRIPTSFRLRDQQVDELIWAGRELLLNSREYQRLVAFVGGTLPNRTPRPVDD